METRAHYWGVEFNTYTFKHQSLITVARLIEEKTEMTLLQHRNKIYLCLYLVMIEDLI